MYFWLHTVSMDILCLSGRPIDAFLPVWGSHRAVWHDNTLSFLQPQCVLNDKLGLLLNTAMYEPDNEAHGVFHLSLFTWQITLHYNKQCFSSSDNTLTTDSCLYTHFLLLYFYLYIQTCFYCPTDYLQLEAHELVEVSGSTCSGERHSMNSSLKIYVSEIENIPFHHDGYALSLANLFSTCHDTLL